MLALAAFLGLAIALAGCGKQAAENVSTNTPQPSVPAEQPTVRPNPLAKPKSEPGFTTTKTGLQYKDVKLGPAPWPRSIQQLR